MLFHVLQVGLDTAAVEVAENIAKAAEPALQAAPQQVEQRMSKAIRESSKIAFQVYKWRNVQEIL